MVSHGQKKREFGFTDDDFRYISKVVGEKVGIVLKEQKKDMVYSRIARRLRALGMSSVGQYVEYLEGPKGDAEITDFVNAITTNLTKFFREDHHFEHLAKVLKAESDNCKLGKRYRIWSAGCSAGMEAYSTAITACDNIGNIDSWDFRILATDIDTNVLKVGADGVYKDKDVEEIPAHLRKRFATKCKNAGFEDKSEMTDSVKKLVAFKQLNLLEEWPMRGKFDVIFCRNVVIYFDKPTQIKLFNRIADLLEDDGWLYIGHSENLSSVAERFELIGRTIYRKVK